MCDSFYRIYLLIMVHTTDGETSARNLLSKPGNEKPQEFERQQVQYEDLTGDFYHESIDFSKQFCSIYAVRLAELRETLIPRVVAKWGEFYIVLF